MIACLLVVAPWWARNIAITGAFLPTGSQGHINLPAGFSQRALDNEGRGRSNSGDGAQELEAAGIDPHSLEYEVRLAQHRFALARAWMRSHPREVIELMGLHVWQELRHELFKVNVELDWFERHVTKRPYTWETAPGGTENSPTSPTARQP